MQRSAPVLLELRQHRTAPAYKRAASLACHGHCTDAHGPGAPSACSPLRERLTRHDVFVVQMSLRRSKRCSVLAIVTLLIPGLVFAFWYYCVFEHHLPRFL